MTPDTQPSPFFVIKHFRIGRGLQNPAVTIVRLSRSKDDGLHVRSGAYALTVDQMARAPAKAASDIRKRSN